MTAARKGRHISAGFVAIILFKYFKGAIFAVVGIAALHIARLSAPPSVEEIGRFLRVTSENQIVKYLARLIHEVTPGQAIGLGVISLFVAAVFIAEGTLLACRIWWSTYFTIVLTALGLPLEVYEIFRHPARPRTYVIMAINAAILVFLWRRRNEFKRKI
jgi:uncharacterized membrane protein (DUF2068 family)